MIYQEGKLYKRKGSILAKCTDCKKEARCNYFFAAVDLDNVLEVGAKVIMRPLCKDCAVRRAI